MEETRGERQPLLPAARERTRELFRPIGEAEILERRLHPLPAVGQLVHAGHEIEILADREILVV